MKNDDDEDDPFITSRSSKAKSMDKDNHFSRTLRMSQSLAHILKKQQPSARLIEPVLSPGRSEDKPINFNVFVSKRNSMLNHENSDGGVMIVGKRKGAQFQLEVA